MKIIGFRNSTTSLRYAIIEWDCDNPELVNGNSEHALKYPTELTSNSQKLKWLFDEVERILRKNTGCEYVGIKISEYGRAEKKSTRYTSYADAMVYLACAKSNVPVQDYIYSQLPTSSAKVKEYAEKLVGKTDKYWNPQIADAIAVSFAVKKKIHV